MSVVEDLVLALQTRGFREGTAEVDATAGAVRKTDKAAKDASTSTAGLGKSFGGLKDMAKSAAGTLGVGGLVLGLGEAVMNAQHFQQAQAQLGASLHANVRKPAADATNQMSAFSDSLSEHGGFAATEGIQGMTQFLRVTHDVQRSEGDLTLATNVARGAHVDLGRAVRAVTMLEQGRTTGLSRLGIVVPKITSAYDALRASHKHATVEQIAAAKATDALATKQGALARVTHQYAGATQTYSKTSAGAISNLRNSVEVFSVSVGTMLLPVVNDAARALGWVLKQLEKLLPTIKELLPVVLGAAAAWGAYKVVTMVVSGVTAILESELLGNVTAFLALIPEIGSASEAMALFGMAMDSIPIVGWIAGIAAMVGAVVLLYHHVKWFRDAVNATWHWLKTATVDAFHAVTGAIDTAIKWMQSHWPLVVGILTGPIGLAIAEIVKHWDTIKKLPSELLHLFTTIGPKIAAAIVWPFTTAFNWVKHHLPHFHTVHVGPVGIPLPSFQAGGPVTSTGPALVGERGPEIVTLPRGSYVHPNDALGADRPIVIYNVLDGKIMSQSVIRQGLLQTARGG